MIRNMDALLIPDKKTSPSSKNTLKLWITEYEEGVQKKEEKCQLFKLKI